MLHYHRIFCGESPTSNLSPKMRYEAAETGLIFLKG
jgi:hypothetical protein